MKVLILLLLCARCLDCTFLRVFLSDVDEKAVCMDGSPAGYYWEEALQEPEDDHRIWLVYLSPGFWCWDEKSCRHRAGVPHTISSITWKPTRQLDGIFSSEHGAALRRAHKAMVPQCTSDAHMGDASAFGFEFRGARVVQAVLKHLLRRGLGRPGTRHMLIFGGGSAGARGAMVHLDYIPELLGPAAKNVQVLGFLDSPLWMDVEPIAPGVVSFREQTQNVYRHFNVRHLGADCARAFDEDSRWKCLFGQYRMPFVKGAYFLVASQFDTFQAAHNMDRWGNSLYNSPLGVQEQTFALQVATRTRLLLGDLARFSALRKQQESPLHALFSFACWSHAISAQRGFFTDRLDKGATMNEALKQLLDDLPSKGSLSKVRNVPLRDSLRWVDGCTGVSCGTGCSRGVALTRVHPTTTSTTPPPTTTTASPTTTSSTAATTASTVAPSLPSTSTSSSTSRAPLATAAPSVTERLVPVTIPKRQAYGAACSRGTDCLSGVCGSGCTARNASCICPVVEREDDRDCAGSSSDGGAATCTACCATVAAEDADVDGRVCVADSLAKSSERHAFALPHGGRALLAARGRGSVLPDVLKAPRNVVRVIGARRFGTACQAWSECSSGVCGASCSCDSQLVGGKPCTCTCASGDVLSQGRVPTCCSFFVGVDPCASSCPPCSEQQCLRLPGDCRWGCTRGASEGTCSARPEAFLNEQCQECCNANFCKANASGLRGDWIAHARGSGPWPGLDGKGDDLWTREDVPCPKGKAWVGGSCQVACELPDGYAVHQILDLGNSTWFQDVAFSDGARIHVVCEPGHQGSRKLWKLSCEAGTWRGGDDLDCRPVHCPVPQDPVGVWMGRGEFNQTLRLQCAQGYAPAGGASELRCSHLGPWEVPVAKCMPQPRDVLGAQAFRKGMQSAALMSVIGSVATLTVVIALCWREPSQRGGRPRQRDEEAADPARPEVFARAGVGRAEGLE